MPIHFQINFETFISLLQIQDLKIVIETIYAIGNMFESMPETINIMFDLNLFQIFEQYSQNCSYRLKNEITICCSTAICFSSDVHNYFLEKQFQINIADIAQTSSIDLEYMLVNAYGALLKTFLESSSPADAMQWVEESDAKEMIEELLTRDDPKTKEATIALDNFIEEISKEAQ